MRQITVWTKDETENLFTIAVNNSQVFYILGVPLQGLVPHLVRGQLKLQRRLLVRGLGGAL